MTRPLQSPLALLGALTLVAGLVGIAGMTRAPGAAAFPNPTVDLAGRGFGHGRGMGQYGALGYAVDHGWDHRQILAHFYGGTQEGGLAGGDDGYGMSVRFMNRNAQDTIVVGQVVVDEDPNPGPQPAALVRRVGIDQWAIYYGAGCGGPWSPNPNAVVNSPSVTTRPFAGLLTVCLTNGTRTVHGAVRADDIDNTQVTVNDLAMGPYLRGVVPRESPASWADLGGGSGINALRAQAVAARSYAAAENRYPGVAKTCDTQACQVYAGVSQTVNGSTVGEDARTNQAIAETAGQVRLRAGAVARTEYSSSTGGFSAGGAFPAVVDEGDDTAANPNHTWTARIPVPHVEAKYARGTLVDVEVLERNGLGADGGRALRVRLVFSSGNLDMSGDDLRRDFGLKSNWFTPVNIASFPYHVVTRDGGVFSFGGAAFHGSLPGIGVRTPAKDITEGPGGGYWILGDDGGVFSFGVPFYGSLGDRRLNSPVVGMEGTAARQGYWLVAGDGGIFSFGDAPFFGSTGSMRLNAPVVGMAPPPSGEGYWLVATDGGIFSFGNVPFLGSTGSIRLNQPMFGMAATPTGQGYWMVARDGGVFSFGDATFHGSLPGRGVKETAVELVASPTGAGYLIVTAEGRVHGFGDASSGGGPRDVVPNPNPAVGAGRALP